MPWPPWPVILVLFCTRPHPPHVSFASIPAVDYENEDSIMQVVASQGHCRNMDVVRLPMAHMFFASPGLLIFAAHPRTACSYSCAFLFNIALTLWVSTTAALID